MHKLKYVFVILVLLFCCSSQPKRFSEKKASAVIHEYISSIYENDYVKFQGSTYSQSEELKKLSFDSLVLALKLNIELKKIFGRFAIEDFNLSKKGSIGIAEIPLAINFEELNKLRFRVWRGKKGIYEPQTRQFFEFREVKQRLLVDLEADLVNMDVYLNFIKRSIAFLNKVHTSVRSNEAEGKTIEEFAQQFE